MKKNHTIIFTAKRQFSFLHKRNFWVVKEQFRTALQGVSSKKELITVFLLILTVLTK
jgi:hypothetical protein